jgi:hypothetical protein
LAILEEAMKRDIYFGAFQHGRWPDPRELERYFIETEGGGWPTDGGNDDWGFTIDGLYGTAHLPNERDRVVVDLSMIGFPGLGVRLIYAKWDGRTQRRDDYASKGDLRRLNETVYAAQDTPVCVGTVIPFAEAYRAVKEFMETDGELPKCIEWISVDELPPARSSC